MGITIFILLFSIGMMALLAVLLKTEKITQLIFASGMALLVVFDFSILSLDKIYFLHQDQDSIYLEKQRVYDKRISEQLALYQHLTKIQLDVTLQLLALNNKQETESGIIKKIQWRDELLAQMNALEFDEDQKSKVSTEINAAVSVFLMERLNQELRQGLGHRIYSEFVRSRPRSEWTDELFVKEIETYLNKQNIMKEQYQFLLSQLKEFKINGVLIEKPVKAELDQKGESKKTTK